MAPRKLLRILWKQGKQRHIFTKEQATAERIACFAVVGARRPIGTARGLTALREVAQNVSDVNTAFRKAEEQAVKDIEAAKKK